MNQSKPQEASGFKWSNSYIGIILLVLVLLTAGVLSGKLRGLFGGASNDDTNLVEGYQEDALISSNSFLVKIAKSAKSHIKENPNRPDDTGSNSLNNLNRQAHAKEFKHIAKAGPHSDISADVFDWYVVTTDSPSMILKEKENRQELQDLKRLMKKYEKDPDVAKVQPNYIITVGAKSEDAGLRGNSKKQDAAPSTEVLPPADIAPSAGASLGSDITPAPVDDSVPVSDTAPIDPKQEIVPDQVTSNAPNDPFYTSTGTWGQAYQDLWGMTKIRGADAWATTTGSASIVVADVDTGVDRNHPDLAANMWTNPNEIPNNGIDDDNNGFIDDDHGWDFVNHDNDPMDDNGHGTHTAGTIAAVGNNNLGVVGVNWTSKIMPVKFLNANGSGYLSDGIAALQYAADMGARVSSNSWGGSLNSATNDAIAYEHSRGMVVAVAAGNASSDALGQSPASADDAITVSASNYQDLPASFTNWGDKIDVAAPGVDILSTRSSQDTICGPRNVVVADIYCHISGTSMATPHVAGLAALILSKNPNLTSEQVRQIIRKGGLDLGDPGKDKFFGYGRIDAPNSIARASTNIPLAPYISSPTSRFVASGASVQIKGQITGNGFASYKLEYANKTTPAVWTTITSSTTQPTAANTVLGSFNGTNLNDGLYNIRLTATSTTGEQTEFAVYNIVVDNFDTAITAPSTLVNKSQVQIFGTANTAGALPFANYKLEYAPQSSPNTWTLIKSSTVPITNGLLGTWNTTSLTDSATYTLRLTVTATNGVFASFPVNITVDSSIVSGWPKALTGTTKTPVVADLDGDGNKEVLFTVSDSDTGALNIFAYRYDGSLVTGFPANVTIPGQPDGYVYSSSAILVTDINNDGRPEIIVPFLYQTPDLVYSYPSINIYDSSGNLLKNISNLTITAENGNYVFYLDINGDGVKDIVQFTMGGYNSSPLSFTLRAYSSAGQLLSGFPRTGSINTSDRAAGLVSIHDLDNDGHVEFAFTMQDKVYLLNDQLQLVQNWPFQVVGDNASDVRLFSAGNSQITSADINGDGQKELLFINNMSCSVSSGGSATCLLGDKTNVYAMKKDGTPISGWPKFGVTDGYKVYTASGYTAVSLADMDGDGIDDVVLPSNPVAVYTKTNKVLFNTHAGSYASAAHLSDVNADGSIDVAGTSSEVGIFIENRNGLLWQRQTGNPVESPILADLNNDGKMEVIAMNFDKDLITNQYLYRDSIFIWSLPSVAPVTQSWPMFGANIMRENNIHASGTLPTTAPSVSIWTPSPGTPVSGQSVHIGAYAASNPTVSRVEFYAGNTLIGTDTVGSPWDVSWNTLTFPNGDINLSAKAYNSAGDAGVSVAVPVTVNNTVSTTPPHINLTGSPSFSAPVNATTNPAAQTFSVGNTGSSSMPWTAAVNQTWCHVTASGTAPAGGSSNATVTVDRPSVAGLTQGLYTCTITVTASSADNSPKTTSVNYTVTAAADITAPIISSVSITPAANSQGVVPRGAFETINVNATDNVNVTKVEFYVNGTLTCTKTSTVTTNPYTCSWNVPNAPNKTYNLTAKAYDAAGNVSPSSPALSVKTAR